MSNIKNLAKQSIIQYIVTNHGPQDLTIENLSTKIHEVLTTLPIDTVSKTMITEVIHYIDNNHSNKEILSHIKKQMEREDGRTIFKSMFKAILTTNIKKYYYSRYYARKADNAFREFKQVHNIDIRAKSKENLDKVLARLATNQKYYEEKVQTELATRKKNQIFTEQEMNLAEKMLNSDEWVIQHATYAVNTVLEGGDTLLSIGERQRRGMNVDNNHSIDSDGNTDNVFCSVGFGKHPAPRFLSDVSDKVIINLSQMQRNNPGAFNQLWTSGHVAAYRSKSVYETTVFGSSVKATLYGESQGHYDKKYRYDNNRLHKIYLEDEIVVGKHIKPFLTYHFIEVLRSLGGIYRQLVLASINNFDEIKKAFHAIFHGGMMEVHAPAKLHLDPSYSTVHAGAVFTKEMMRAAADGDIPKMQELIAKGAQINIIDITCMHTEPHTPLQMACKHGKAAAVKFLIEKGAYTGLRRQSAFANMSSYNALMFAAEGGHVDCMQYIIDASRRITPTSVKYGEDMLIVNVLSAEGSDSINAVSALGLALRSGKWPAAELLLRNNAKTDEIYLGINGLNGMWNEEITLQFILYLQRQNKPIPKFKDIISHAIDENYFKVLDLLWPKVREMDVDENFALKIMHGDEAAVNFLIKNDYDFSKAVQYLIKEVKDNDDESMTESAIFLIRLPVSILKRLPISVLGDIGNPANFRFINSKETLKWWQESCNGVIDKSLLTDAVETAVMLDSYDYADDLMATYKDDIHIQLTDPWVSHALMFSSVSKTLFLLKHQIVKVGITNYKKYVTENSNGIDAIFGQDTLIEIFQHSLNKENFYHAEEMIKRGYIEVNKIDWLTFLRERNTKFPWKIIQWLEKNAFYQFTKTEINAISVSIANNSSVYGTEQPIKREAVDFFIISKGADINAVDENGRTLLINFIKDSTWNENIIEYLLQKGARVDVGFPLVCDKMTYQTALDFVKLSFTPPSEFIINLLFKAILVQALETRATQRLYGLFASASVTPKQENFFWDNFTAWRVLDRGEIDELKILANQNKHQHCLMFIAKYERKLAGLGIPLIKGNINHMFTTKANDLETKSTDVVVTSATKTTSFEVDNTGDIDYAKAIVRACVANHTSMEYLSEVKEEKDIFDHINKIKPQDKAPILHIMLNVPDLGTLATPQSLAAFKQTGGKVVITMVEFAKHANRSNASELQRQALSYMEQADQVIFLDENDQASALRYANNKLPPSVVIPVPATVPSCETPLQERGGDIISFGMIRNGKGYAHIVKLAGLIKESKDANIANKKILIVGSVSAVQDQNMDATLFKLMKDIYPTHAKEFLNKTPFQLKALLKTIQKDPNIKPALPIELHIDVPKEDLIPLFKRCTYSYLPAYRGATLRNTSMSSSMANNFVTYMHEGRITPDCLKAKGKYSNASVLIPYNPQQDFYYYSAEKVFSDIITREKNPALNIKTAEAANNLVSNELSAKVIAEKHNNIYKQLQQTNTLTARTGKTPS